MSQSDIYEILKNKRLSGDTKYYSVDEIRKLLREKDLPNHKRNVYDQVTTLHLFGYLETSMKVNHIKKRLKLNIGYRLKKDVLST